MRDTRLVRRATAAFAAAFLAIISTAAAQDATPNPLSSDGLTAPPDATAPARICKTKDDIVAEVAKVAKASFYGADYTGKDADNLLALVQTLNGPFPEAQLPSLDPARISAFVYTDSRDEQTVALIVFYDKNACALVGTDIDPKALQDFNGKGV